jgi:hypothetical protein
MDWIHLIRMLEEEEHWLSWLAKCSELQGSRHMSARNLVLPISNAIVSCVHHRRQRLFARWVASACFTALSEARLRSFEGQSDRQMMNWKDLERIGRGIAEVLSQHFPVSRGKPRKTLITIAGDSAGTRNQHLRYASLQCYHYAIPCGPFYKVCVFTRGRVCVREPHQCFYLHLKQVPVSHRILYEGRDI